MKVSGKEIVTEMKILGVIFDNNRISRTNLVKIENNMTQTIIMWNNVKIKYVRACDSFKNQFFRNKTFFKT